jgi:hypothetical protein
MGTPAGTVYRFGPFELDTAAGELLKQGSPVSLQEQPFRLLCHSAGKLRRSGHAGGNPEPHLGAKHLCRFRQQLASRDWQASHGSWR